MESQGWEGGQASKAGGERKARSPAWTAAPPGPPGLVQGAEQRGADGSDHVIQLTETLDLPGIFRGCTYLISPAAPRAVTCEIPISQVAKLRPTGSRGYRRAGMPSGSGSLQSPGGKGKFQRGLPEPRREGDVPPAITLPYAVGLPDPSQPEGWGMQGRGRTGRARSLGFILDPEQGLQLLYFPPGFPLP